MRTRTPLLALGSLMVMLNVSGAGVPREWNTQADNLSVVAGVVAVPSTQIDSSSFVGSWVNVNSATSAISRIVITSDAGVLSVHGYANCGGGECDWGTVTGIPYASSAGGTKAIAFTASFDFGFKGTILTGSRKGARLVVSNFNEFKDASNRSNYALTERFKLAR